MKDEIHIFLVELLSHIDNTLSTSAPSKITFEDHDLRLDIFIKGFVSFTFTMDGDQKSGRELAIEIIKDIEEAGHLD